MCIIINQLSEVCMQRNHEYKQLAGDQPESQLNRTPAMPASSRNSSSMIARSYYWSASCCIPSFVPLTNCSISDNINWYQQHSCDATFSAVVDTSNAPLRALYSKAYSAYGKPADEKDCDATDACCGVSLCLLRVPYTLVIGPIACFAGLIAGTYSELCCPRAQQDPLINQATQFTNEARFREFLQNFFAATDITKNQLIDEKHGDILICLYNPNIFILDDDRKKMFNAIHERGHDILKTDFFQFLSSDVIDYVLKLTQSERFLRHKATIASNFDETAVATLEESKLVNVEDYAQTRSLVKAQSSTLAKHGIFTQIHHILDENDNRDEILKNLFNEALIDPISGGNIVRQYAKEEEILTPGWKYK
jgi:hypothetical protein